jgi:hypothetical protein
MKRIKALISIFIVSLVAVLSTGCASGSNQGGESSDKTQANEGQSEKAEDNTSEGTKVAVSTKTYEVFEKLGLQQSYDEILSVVTEAGMTEKEPLKEGALETQRSKYALESDSQYAYLEFEVWNGEVITIKYTVQMDIQDTGFKAERALYDELVGKVESKQISSLEQLEKEIGKGYMIQKEYKKFKDLSSGEKYTYRWADTGIYYIEATVDESGNIIGSLMGSIRK